MRQLKMQSEINDSICTRLHAICTRLSSFLKMPVRALEEISNKEKLSDDVTLSSANYWTK